jgi:hypothetical protein
MFFFSFIISHTAWVIVFKHGNKPSRLDKKVSFVGSWETTYTPFVHRVMGLGHFYRLKWGEGRLILCSGFQQLHRVFSLRLSLG